ncbi:MAG: diguanylate cyclase (GGDEF)-like protein/PAS domain S-box-containing protein [Psychromonas sp.]|jgi:diguanylate cyclase (GGDEF)-like protein/PAS domain S-box-containing protein
MDKNGIAAFKQLVESAPILFYVADKNLKFTYINPFFSKIHHISQQQAVGLHISEVIGIDGFNGNLKNYKKVLTGEIVKFNTSFFKLDGNPHYCYAIYEPLIEKGEVVGFTGVVIDTTAEHELDQLSKTDLLTQLSNRRGYEYDIANILKGDITLNYGMLILDIDFFKKINDQLGHDMGDNALINLGKLLENIIEFPSKVFRIGGEEFAIILYDLKGEDELRKRADYICEKVASSVIIEDKNITVSIGAILFNAGDDRSLILKKADVALYTCKNNGRNQAHVSNSNQRPALLTTTLQQD